MKTYDGLELIVNMYLKSRWFQIEYLGQEYSFFPTGALEFKKYSDYDINDWMLFLKENLIK